MRTSDIVPLIFLQVFGVNFLWLKTRVVPCAMLRRLRLLVVVPLPWLYKGLPLDQPLAVLRLLVFKSRLLFHALTALSLCRSHTTGTAFSSWGC